MCSLALLGHCLGIDIQNVVSGIPVAPEEHEPFLDLGIDACQEFWIFGMLAPWTANRRSATQETGDATGDASPGPDTRIAAGSSASNNEVAISTTSSSVKFSA